MFSWKNSSTTAKCIAVSVAGILLSVGLCGISFLNDERGTLEYALIGAVLMVFSTIALVVTLIVAFVHATVTGKSSSRPQTLFGDDEEKK
jgi:uncharacterized membrane protein